MKKFENINLREKRIHKLCISYFIEIITTKNQAILNKHKKILVKYGKLTEFNHNNKSACFSILGNRTYEIEIEKGK